jgi:hypothetical protein
MHKFAISLNIYVDIFVFIYELFMKHYMFIKKKSLVVDLVHVKYEIQVI